MMCPMKWDNMHLILQTNHQPINLCNNTLIQCLKSINSIGNYIRSRLKAKKLLKSLKERRKKTFPLSKKDQQKDMESLIKIKEQEEKIYSSDILEDIRYEENINNSLDKK